MPQSNQVDIARSQNGPYAAVSNPLRIGYLSLVSTGVVSGYLTAQASTDGGITWLEYAGPAISKSANGGSPNAFASLRPMAYHDRIYALQCPNPATIGLYAFDLISLSWITVNAAIGAFPGLPGVTYPNITIFGINSSGYGVALIYTVAGGGIAQNQWNVMTFNISGAGAQGFVVDPTVLPSQNILGPVFAGVKPDGSIFFAVSTNNGFGGFIGDLTIFSWINGAAPGGYATTMGTPGAPLFDANTSIMNWTLFGVIGARYLDTSGGIFQGGFDLTALSIVNNFPRFPLFYPLQAFLLMPDADGNQSLQVSWEVVPSTWSAPLSLFSGAGVSGNQDVTSGYIESIVTAAGITTVTYGVASNIRRFAAGELLLTTYYWKIAVRFTAVSPVPICVNLSLLSGPPGQPPPPIGQ